MKAKIAFIIFGLLLSGWICAYVYGVMKEARRYRQEIEDAPY